ncbi:alpha/beta fold hydrolase [Pseudoroseicyclus aestuarii]|uniref:alpha/beta fold hydrolase n=1 Tax=Pseudoroseicyclus aestuarii TaxID=1795041 RepID=UPI003CCC53ED
MALGLGLLAVLLLAGCAWTERRAARREALAHEAYPPLGQLIEVGGRQVHAFVSGTGPDLVLIHGASGNLRDFTFDLVDLLNDRYRVIAFDRPGFGYTDPLDASHVAVWGTAAATPAEEAALLQQAAAQLGADRPIVLGHSYGGAVAAAWALNHPDHIAAFVDLAGATMPWEGGLGPLYSLSGTGIGGAVAPPLIAAYVEEDQIGAAIEGIFAPDLVPAGYREAVGAELALVRSTQRVNAREIGALNEQVAQMAPRYPALALPVEIVHGDADTIVPLDTHSEPLSRLVPGAHLTVLEGVGHMPHHVRPEAVTAAIDRAASRAGLR